MTDFFAYFNTGAIDILGFFAGACLLSSMIARKILLIKILLLTGSLSWLTYGTIQGILPIVVINALVSITGIIEVARLLRNRRTPGVSPTG